MQLTLSDSQEVDISIKPTDKRGNPAPLQSPVFESSDTSVLVLVDGADPQQKIARAVGAIGAAMITFTGDADLGDGVVPIIGTMDVVVIAGQAVAVELTAGAPREQGGAQPAARRGGAR